MRMPFVVCTILALAALATCQAFADEIPSDGFVTWEVSHPELRETFGHPFTPEGRAHRAKAFVPWPCEIHESELPAIQPTVVIGQGDGLFVDGYSPKSWEFGMLGRSTDGGKTWAHVGSPFDMRFRVPKGSKHLGGVRSNGVGITRDGSLLVHFGVQYNDGRETTGGYDDPSYRLDEYVVRSPDQGKTWDAPVKLNATDLEMTGSQKCRFAQLPDGRVALVMGSWDRAADGEPIPQADRYARTYLYTSDDDGRTWQRSAKPICFHGYEPDLLALPSGRLLLAIRYQRSKLPSDPADLVSPHLMRSDKPPYTKSKQVGSGLVARFTAVLHSDDGGKTWTEPRLVTGFDEQTGSMVRLSDGTIILPFGYKTDTRGQRFVASYDEGETWSRTVYQLHADGQYASSVVLADDTIVTVIHDTKGMRVHSLRWRAPSRERVAARGFWRPRIAEPLGIVPGEQAQPAKRDLRVTDFGAVADGKTDCLEPIQRAIDTVSADGGVVRFPKSDQLYLVGGTIVVRSNHVELSGSGATIKLADGAANGTKNQRTTESQVHVIRVTGKRKRQVKDVSIKGLTIDANIYGQKDFYNPRAIVVEYADGVLVKDVKIVRTFVGLDFGAGSSNCEARDCVMEDWTEDAFDASGDADKGSGAITTNIRFINCHARGAPNSTGNAWEIEDGVRHVRVVDCSVSDVPRGNAFGIRNHWTAGPIDVSRDIELRRVTITNVGGKYGIYSHSAPRDRFPTNRLTDVRLIEVVCPAPILFYGPLESVEIAGCKLGVIHLGYDYGAKTSPEPGKPQPLDDTTVRITNTQARHVNINAQSGTFKLNNVLIDAGGKAAFDHAINIAGGSDVYIRGCTVTGAAKAGLALRQQASPRIVNSILWGNRLTFLIESSAKPSLRHCCIRDEIPAEVADNGGNFNKDPQFTRGPSGGFFLSHTDSGQTTNSPCVDAGSEPAAFRGLDEFTTRTDQTRDTGTVDVGYHYVPNREGERHE